MRVASLCCSSPLDGTVKTLNATFWGEIQWVFLPLSWWCGMCLQTSGGWAPTTRFFSALVSFSFLIKRAGIAKNQRSVICSLNQIRSLFFWLQYIWSWILYWIVFNLIHWHLIFISSLVCIPHNLISFSFCDNSFFILFKYFFLIFFLYSIPNYFGWLRIWHCYLFKFAFYGVTPHNLYHEFWRIDRVDFDLLMSFFKIIFFEFHPSIFGLLKIGIFFLTFVSLGLS